MLRHQLFRRCRQSILQGQYCPKGANKSVREAVKLRFKDKLNSFFGNSELDKTEQHIADLTKKAEQALYLSGRFGKVLQQHQSMTINRDDNSTSISTQMDSLIPASKISHLTQGKFVGTVSGNFDERIEQKIFHSEIVVDVAKVSAETKAYEPIPVIAEFTNKDGFDNLT